MNCNQEIRVARLIVVWMASVITIMCVFASDNPIFQIGPNDDLVIFTPLHLSIADFIYRNPASLDC